MILFLGILLILYSLIARKKYSVWVGLFFVLLIMGFQEGIPGDYETYKEAFMHGGAEGGRVGSTVKEGEFAYIWLTQTCSKFMNFHWFVFFMALIQSVAIGLMIKDYAIKNYQFFGVLVVFFTFNIMLIQMKAMRQGYAIELLLLAYYFLSKRKYLLSFFLCILTYGFHNSSIVVMPFFIVLWIVLFLRRKTEMTDYVTPIINKQKGFKIPLLVTLGLIVFYILKFVVFANYINPILEGLDFFEYAGYLDTIETRSIALWILFYYSSVVFFVTLYFINEKDYFRKYIAFLTILSIYLMIGVFGFGNLMRINAYLVIFSIVTFPNIAGMLHKSYGRQVALLFILFNIAFLMYTSVGNMVTPDISDDGTGFGTFTFSFL